MEPLLRQLYCTSSGLQATELFATQTSAAGLGRRILFLPGLGEQQIDHSVERGLLRVPLQAAQAE